MAVQDSLLKTALTEVRYAIPVEILAMAGGQPFIDKIVAERLEEVRTKTLKNIPPSWKHKVVRYIVTRLKQSIFEAWKESDRNNDLDRWQGHTMSQGRINEFLEEYMEAESSADDLMNTILHVNSMRWQASVLGALQ